MAAGAVGSRSGAPRIEEVDHGQLEELLVRIRAVLGGEDYALVEKVVRSYLWLTSFVREQGATIARLRRFLGRSKSERSSELVDKGLGGPAGSAGPGSQDPEGPDGTGGGRAEGEGEGPGEGAGATVTGGSGAVVTEPEPKKRKGHGRLGASAYPDAVTVTVPHECLRAGDGCPSCQRGTLFDLEPAVILKIIGRPPLVATCWACGRLRCSACGEVFTATTPVEARGDKYDATAVSMLAILWYGIGMPGHRLARLQDDLRTPIPVSTQWEILDENVAVLEPVHAELTRQGAEAPLLHADDTSVRILDFVGKRRARLVARGALDDPERTGLHTTAIVAITAEHRTIVIVRSGRKHAGENLAELLEQRAPERPPPIVMSDALACNKPKGHTVVDAFCLTHARRNFVDELGSFPEEGRHALEAFRQVYRVDDLCRERALSPEERLEAHRRESGPVMDGLRAWMTAGIEEKRIEPSSGLGKACHYMLKRWDKLTLFLRVAGAPLDNNIAERALKMIICRRKASLFFRTQHGADVADIYMTVLHTAHHAGESAFDYLTALLRHPREVGQSPGAWLPWNYRETLRLLAERTPGQVPLAA